MVEPLQKFEAIARQWGNEIDLIWETKESRPVNWKIYIFKRSGTNVTQEEIDSYFQSIDDLSDFEYNGLFVFDKFKSETDTAYIHPDYIVLNDTPHYYYKAVIRDESTGECSIALAADATAISSITVKIQDGKDLVAKAITKLFDNIKNEAGRKILLSKEFTVVKHFPLKPPAESWFMIERINGANKHLYWGHQKGTVGNDTVFGSTDSDIIRTTFVTLKGNDTRDLVANLLRAYKIHLERLIKVFGNYKVNNCQITIEGDYQNPAIHGDNALGITVIFALEIENEAKNDELEITDHQLDNDRIIIKGV